MVLGVDSVKTFDVAPLHNVATLNYGAYQVEKEQDLLTMKQKPNVDTLSFGGKKDVPVEEPKKKKSGFFKKAAVALASSVVPGLGQAINGQWGKAAFYTLGAPALTIAAWCVNPLLGVATGALLEIGNIVSAYRNA